MALEDDSPDTTGHDVLDLDAPTQEEAEAQANAQMNAAANRLSRAIQPHALKELAP